MRPLALSGLRQAVRSPGKRSAPGVARSVARVSEAHPGVGAMAPQVARVPGCGLWPYPGYVRPYVARVSEAHPGVGAMPPQVTRFPGRVLWPYPGYVRPCVARVTEAHPRWERRRGRAS